MKQSLSFRRFTMCYRMAVGFNHTMTTFNLTNFSASCNFAVLALSDRSFHGIAVGAPTDGAVCSLDKAM